MRPFVFLVTMLVSTNIQAEILYYGGDWDGNGYFNGAASLPSLYDDFDLSSQSHITGAYVHQFVETVPTTATAIGEIRTGISQGVGGTVVKTFAGTVSEISETGQVSVSGLKEVRFRVTGLNFELNAGRYWMQLTAGWSFGPATLTSGTTGQNSIGSPIGNGLFVYSPFNQQFWDHDPYDLSFGVEGHAVPEPATLLGLGIPVLISRRKRKRSVY